jgi:ABC-type polysaccharide/polyol phosphate transport system ATPase subunit
MLAIQLNDIWKRYYIKYNRRSSLKEAFGDFLRGTNHKSEFWALKNISLEVQKGEALGIIGKNASGKTTLLKLLCGITKPTRGSIKVNGKVAGLLELGAGFQDNLTGRKNIYLNGLILGLSRKEIQRSIDSIIDFADIGDFIDAPVRTYSAGMYLRLGFAIAIQIDPDTLLIDEVLAVGDEAFQQKCLYKIREFKERNNTLIIVSHNMDIVNQLCDNVIWLEEGKIIREGKPKEMIKDYGMFMQRESKQKAQGKINSEVEITDVRFLDGQANCKDEFSTGDEMIIRIEYFAHKKIYNPVFGLAIFRDDGIHITGPNTKFSNFKIDSIEGRGKINFVIDALPLLPGNYDVSVAIHIYEDELDQYDSLDKLFRFKVIEGKVKERYGFISITHRWRLK